MPEVIDIRPLHKLELTDELRLQPSGFLHFFRREARAPTSGFLLREVRKRTILDLQRLELLEEFSLASWLISNDIDLKTVSSMLRHSNPNTKFGIYGHAVDSRKLLAQGQFLNRLLASDSVQ
jgi:integrase